MTDAAHENPKESSVNASFQDKNLAPLVRDISDQLVHLGKGLTVIQMMICESEIGQRRSRGFRDSVRQAMLSVLIVACCLFSLVLGYNIGFKSGISQRPTEIPGNSVSHRVDL